jgi:hypothetical protein
LRNALAAARNGLGLPAQSFTNTPASQTRPHASDINELRDGVK